MPEAIEKLNQLKRVLDRNLSTKSFDILPTINEVITMLEAEVKPVVVVEKKIVKPVKEYKEVITVEVKETPPVYTGKEAIPMIPEDNIEILRAAYEEKIGKPVSNRYKNDKEWIIDKIKD